MDKAIFNCNSGDGCTLEVGKLNGQANEGEGVVWLRTKGGRPVHLSAQQVSDLLGILATWRNGG